MKEALLVEGGGVYLPSFFLEFVKNFNFRLLQHKKDHRNRIGIVLPI